MTLVDEHPVPLPCKRCGGTGIIASEWCMDCGGVGADWFDRSALFTLAHNLAVIGFGFAAFRAGDNFGFHMGEDQGQCTCQWTPSRGVPYRGSTPRCIATRIATPIAASTAPSGPRAIRPWSITSSARTALP